MEEGATDAASLGRAVRLEQRHDCVAVAGAGIEQCGATVVSQRRICAALEQKAHDGLVAFVARPDERSLAGFGLQDNNVRALALVLAVEQQLGDAKVAVAGRVMQRRVAVAVDDVELPPPKVA